MIHNPVALHSNDLSVLIRTILELDKERRALAGISDVLIVIVSQRYWFASRQGRYTHEGFHCWAELISERSSCRVLNHPQLFRFGSQPRANHGMVEMNPDTLGVNREASVFINIRKPYIRLHG